MHVSDAEVRATTASRNTQLIIPSTSGQLTFLLVGHILLFGLAAASLSAQGSLHNVSHFSNWCTRCSALALHHHIPLFYPVHVGALPGTQTSVSLLSLLILCRYRASSAPQGVHSLPCLRSHAYNSALSLILAQFNPTQEFQSHIKHPP